MPRAPSDKLIDRIYDAAVEPQLWDRNYILTVQRSVRKGSYTKEEAKALEPLVPHLGRALRIGAHLHAYRTLARDQQELLDLLNIGIVVIDEFGKARCVNRKAHKMVGKGQALTLRRATISASEHSGAAELAGLIAATASGGTGGALALQRQDFCSSGAGAGLPLTRRNPGQDWPS